MRARVVAGVVGCGISLLTVAAGAQAPPAAFPAEPTSNAVAPAATVTARAGEAPPVTTAPNWNVGAGIFSSGGLFGLSGEGLPTYDAALERRLSRRAWLALNARFSYLTREAPVYPTTAEPNPAGTYRVSTRSAGVLLGARYVIAQGLVDVSGSAAAFLNYQRFKGEDRGAVAESGPSRRRELGLLLGMAMERELIEALALRLSLNLVSASVAFQDAPTIDEVGVKQPRTLVTGRLSFAVEPGLHLHFYF